MVQLLNVVKRKSLGTEGGLFYERAGSGMVREGQTCTEDPGWAIPRRGMDVGQDYKVRTHNSVPLSAFSATRQ